MFSLIYVDDEPELLEIGKLFLESAGDLSVTTVLSGEEALLELAKQPFDAVVADYQMPEMDGIELLKRVRENYGLLPFILFTGKGREEIVVEAINNGADFYLQKGGDPRAQFVELAHKIRQAVSRRRAETALSDSERRLAGIIDFLPDATLAIDAGGHVIAWNRAIEEMTGIPAVDMIGKGNYEYALPFYGKRRPILIDMVFDPELDLAGNYSAIRRDKERFSAETDLPQPKGRRIWVLAKASPLYNRDGEVTGAIEAIRDITDRKKSEEELRAANEQLAAAEEELRGQYDELSAAQDKLRKKSEELERFFTMSLDLLCIADTDGNFIRVNPEWERTLGFSTSELEGRRFFDFLHPDDVPSTLAAVAELGRQKEVTGITSRFRCRDGSYRWIEWRAHPEGKLIFATARDITDKKRVEDTLDLLRRQDSEALRVARMGHFEYDVAAQAFVFNDEYYAMIGTTAQEMGGYVITAAEFSQKFIPVEDAELVRETLDKAVVSEDPGFQARFESPFILPDGTRAIMDVWFRIEKDASGKTVRFYGVNQDITERTRAETALRESEEKYRLISENSPDMIFFIDPDGYVRYVNTLAAQAMKVEPSAIVGKQLSELFSPGPARHHAEAIREVMATRTPFRKEMYEELPSGGIWIDIRLSPVIDGAGRVLGVLGLSHDISDRKHAEEALRESEQKYRVLVENSHDIIYTSSAEGILTFVSPSWNALLGHEPAYVIGKAIQNFVHPADIPAFEAFLASVVSTGQRKSDIEYRVFHADGSIRIHTSTIAPILNDRGSIVSYIGNARDITEMKQFQNAIRESNRKLNLLSSITRHDVVNQLTVVQGYTQLAIMKKPDPVIADFLAKITSAVDTIRRQIEFTKSYQDLGVQAPAWFRVADVIKSVRPPGLALVCTCETAEIFSDPMIAKVFFNLFDNTVQYGKKVTTVTVGCELRGDELVITFADNGVGIPLDEKQKIFDKGYGQHTGFGLFLAREILAITGITIHETGTHGKGALFEIVVPKGAYRS